MSPTSYQAALPRDLGLLILGDAGFMSRHAVIMLYTFIGTREFGGSDIISGFDDLGRGKRGNRARW
jgi:hypothetical protein